MARAGWGERLKTRAKQIGLTDVAVARLLGITQRRYSAYTNESREPDFETLMAICRALLTTPDAVLGFSQHPTVETLDAVAIRIESVVAAMNDLDRERSLAVLETLARYPSS